jgi:2-amino-4-hydroxy-6-hydroxymethyldihydropteridine diphosphokinase
VALARVGLGSNLGDSRGNIARAVAALEALGTVTARSSLFRSKPWGVLDQPDFLNAAVLLETALAPHALLAALKRIEVEVGRTETVRWGPRVVDLDILAYDDVVLDDPDLTIPHPRLHERAFALVPLAQIDPSFAEAARRLSPASLAEVAEEPGG